MSDVIEIYGTIVGVGACLNNASGVGIEIEKDGSRDLVTIAGISRDEAKAAAGCLGKAACVIVVTRDAD